MDNGRIAKRWAGRSRRLDSLVQCVTMGCASGQATDHAGIPEGMARCDAAPGWCGVGDHNGQDHHHDPTRMCAVLPPAAVDCWSKFHIMVPPTWTVRLASATSWKPQADRVGLHLISAMVVSSSSSTQTSSPPRMRDMRVCRGRSYRVAGGKRGFEQPERGVDRVHQRLNPDPVQLGEEARPGVRLPPHLHAAGCSVSCLSTVAADHNCYVEVRPAIFPLAPECYEAAGGCISVGGHVTARRGDRSTL